MTGSRPSPNRAVPEADNNWGNSDVIPSTEADEAIGWGNALNNKWV